MTASSRIRLSPAASGIARVNETPPGSIDAANRVLQKNHDDHHIFWRDVAGHNHVVHSVLTTYALGGGPAEIQRAFDDGADIQAPIPAVNWHNVKHLHEPEMFRAHIGTLDHYSDFLAFFEEQIGIHGYQAVINEQCFGGSSNAETMFAQLFEGLYHPMIHLAFGVEFDSPTLVAEALALTASHDSMGIEGYLNRCERAANESTLSRESLMDVYHGAHANVLLRKVARGYTDGPTRVREGVLGQAGHDIESLAARYRVAPNELDERLAEVINCSAYLAGSAQRKDKARKIDFFHLHTATASLSLAILLRQSWINAQIKVRLLEWKTRVDLVWYAASGTVELHPDAIRLYAPGPSAGMDWNALYRATTVVNDDGHLSKFVRALRLGQELSAPFEKSDKNGRLPVKGNQWKRIAQMAYDSTYDRPIEEKWIWGVGFDENWAHVPALEGNGCSSG